MTQTMSFSPALPWAVEEGEVSRLRKILKVAAGVFVVLALLIALVTPPPVERQEAEQLPPRLAQLIVEQKAPPPKPEPKPLPEPKKEEVKKEVEKTPETEPEVVKEVPRERPTEERVKQAREKASKSGLLAMKDQLQALRSFNAEALTQNQTKVGVEGTERREERDLITSRATSTSGGVAAPTIAHAGGGSLAGRQTAQVSAPAGGDATLAKAKAQEKSGRRTGEEIKLAFDANKSAIYGIYQRALRQNPLLEGRVVFRLTIAPTGEVTACSIVSSALNDPELEAKLVARIQLINFGARAKIEPWTGNYHIDFVPAG